MEPSDPAWPDWRFRIEPQNYFQSQQSGPQAPSCGGKVRQRPCQFHVNTSSHSQACTNIQTHAPAITGSWSDAQQCRLECNSSFRPLPHYCTGAQQNNFSEVGSHMTQVPCWQKSSFCSRGNDPRQAQQNCISLSPVKNYAGENPPTKQRSQQKCFTFLFEHVIRYGYPVRWIRWPLGLTSLCFALYGGFPHFAPNQPKFMLNPKHSSPQGQRVILGAYAAYQVAQYRTFIMSIQDASRLML